MSFKSSLQFLNDQKIFYVLGTSKLKLGLSWKNKDQVYDLECRYCQAVYSDVVTSNNFSSSKKAASTEASFLKCQNCGVCQETCDGTVTRKKVSYVYNVGFFPYPNKLFDFVEKYRGAIKVTPEDIKKLKTFKEMVVDESEEPEMCGCEKTECENCFPPLGQIYLNVTDALIASGLNNYEANKRELLVELYASKKSITHQEYINFNKKYRNQKMKAEKEVLASVDMSCLIKTIAESAQFGNNCDEYALESVASTLDAIGIDVWDEEKAITVIDERTNQAVSVQISDNGEVVIKRADGCVKVGIIDKETGMITDIEDEVTDPTESMTEEEKRIFESYVNKKTGTCSEVNIHEYLKENFEYYEHGTIPVSGVIDDVNFNGLIDGIIRAEGCYGAGCKNQNPIINPVINGKRPQVIFEIKKRMKKIFTLEELVERKYDLCQLVLYKILTMNGKGDPTKLLIVQSFGEDINIIRVPVDVQRTILEEFRVGLAIFKDDIKKLKKF